MVCTNYDDRTAHLSALDKQIDSSKQDLNNMP